MSYNPSSFAPRCSNIPLFTPIGKAKQGDRRVTLKKSKKKKIIQKEYQMS